MGLNTCQIYWIPLTSTFFPIFHKLIFFHTVFKTYLKFHQRRSKSECLLQLTKRQDPKNPESDIRNLTQEAPEVEATHRATQEATQKATQEATQGDIQEMTEKGFTEEGDDPKGKRAAAAAFTE